MKKLFGIILLLFVFSCKQELINTKLSGAIFGTSYGIIYNAEANYQEEIDSISPTWWWWEGWQVLGTG